MKTMIVTLLVVMAALVVAQDKVCKTGFDKVNHECIKVVITVRQGPDLKNWDDALELCKNKHGGSQLAQPDTPAKLKLLSKYLYEAGHGARFLWVGGSFINNVWQWATGVRIPTTSHMWHLDEPRVSSSQAHTAIVGNYPYTKRHYLVSEAGTAPGFVCQQ